MTATGFPVTVVLSGGFPVTPVEDGAPVASVQPNGLGTPITYAPNATPMVIVGAGPSPVPGPLDFGSGAYDQTSFTTDFDVAAPHVVLGMFFHYTGTPSFTVMHEGEPLTGKVQLNGDGSGCMIFIGDDLTVEVGSLSITCTGGTFGPFYGRVNEMPFAPDMTSLEWVEENFTGNNKQVYHTAGAGRIYAAVACPWWTAVPTVRGVEGKVWARDMYGAGLDWTPAANTARWTWDGKTAIHNGATTDVTTNTPFATPTTGPIYFRADLTAYTDIPTTTYAQYQANGSGASAGLLRTGDTVSGYWSSGDISYNSFQIRMNNDVTVENIRLYDSTSTAMRTIAGIIASGDDVGSWSYSSTNNMTSALLSVKVKPL